MDRLFQIINDYYFMVDGDNTYDVTDLKNHLNIMVEEEVDMIVGVREEFE